MDNLTIAQLAARYNLAATTMGLPAVKKFSTKAIGMARVAAIEAKLPKPETKIAKVRKVSVSATCRELITAGKSNEEIWAVIKETFQLDDSKKGYPGWNRAQMLRAAKAA